MNLRTPQPSKPKLTTFAVDALVNILHLHNRRGVSGCFLGDQRRVSNVGEVFKKGRTIRGMSVSMNSNGFSLIELLTVIAIMGVLTGLMVPAFQGIAGAGKVPSAATQIAGILEFARNEAMTRQTYVWVGFRNTTGTDGNNELRAAAFASDDGTPIGTRFQLSRVFKMGDVFLTDFGSLKSGTRSLVPSAIQPASLGVNASTPSPALTSGGIEFNRVLAFTPRGEAMLTMPTSSQIGFNRLVDISIRKTRGNTTPAGDADDAVVLAGGSSGKVEVIYQR